MKVLIDTCIIIDALQTRPPFNTDAESIFLLAASKSFEGFLTAKSIADIYYLTHRCTHSDSETRKILTKLLTLFEILDTTGLDCKKAIFSDISDFEDAVMIETAIHTNMDCIVTRNVKDYTRSSISIYQPMEFLNLFD